MTTLSSAQGALATSRTVLPTREKILDAVIDAYHRLGNNPLPLVSQLESKKGDELLNFGTDGNAIDIGVKAVTKLGVPIEHTIGGFMQVTGLSEKQVHDIYCNCHTMYHNVNGDTIARRLRYAVGRQQPPRLQ